MSVKIKPLSHFESDLKRLSKKFHSLLSDIYDLRDELKKNPKEGIPLGANLYKIRLGTPAKVVEKVAVSE